MIQQLKKIWIEPSEKQRKLNEWVLITLIFVSAILIVRYQLRLIHLIEWGDESETIVVTKMMAAGQRLYSEIYNNHGPLTFLPGFIVSKIGNFSIPEYRIPIMILQWLTWLAIYTSPIFKDRSQRVFATLSSAMMMLIFLPRIFGHTYLYQVMSGLLFIIVLVQYALPSYLDIKLSAYRVIFMNFVLYSIPFLAITNLPMVVLIGISSFRIRDWRYNLLGVIIGVVFNLGFLFLYGSWDGYIAYHFYLNSKVLYSGAGLSSFVKSIFEFYTGNFLPFISMIFIFICVSKLYKTIKEVDYFRVFFIIPMCMSLVLRGGELFSLSGLIYIYVITGLSTVLFISEENQSNLAFIFSKLHLYILSGFFLIILYRPIETDNFFYEFPDYSEFSRIAQKITEPNERVLALSFRSYEYLLADRLPASTHFIYLSIQAKYNQMPYKDIYASVAEDILRNRPKIISLDKWNIILDESDLWDNYAADINEVVYNEYYQLRESDIYIRKDVNLLDYGLDPTYGYELQ